MCEAGEDPEYFSTHEIADCTINGKPYYYFVGQDNLTVPTDAGGLIAVECDNLTVRDIDVSDSSMGLEIARSRNVTLENVSADRCCAMFTLSRRTTALTSAAARTSSSRTVLR